MALIDALKKRTEAQQLAGQQTADSAAGTSAQLAELLAAKSGSAGGGGGPKASTMGEMAAIDEAKAALSGLSGEQNLATQEFGQKEAAIGADLSQKQSALTQQNELAGQQLAAQGTMARAGLASAESLASQKLLSRESTHIEEISAGAERAMQQMLTDRKINEANIFQQFHQDQRELAFRRDAAQLEQTAFTLALRDRAYLEEITSIGDARRLEDNVEFAREAARVSMGDHMTDVLKQIGWAEEDLTDTLAFNAKMAGISLSDALSIINAEMTQHNNENVVKGLTDLGAAGVDYWAKAPAATELPTFTSDPFESQSTYNTTEA